MLGINFGVVNWDLDRAAPFLVQWLPFLRSVGCVLQARRFWPVSKMRWPVSRTRSRITWLNLSGIFPLSVGLALGSCVSIHSRIQKFEDSMIRRFEYLKIRIFNDSEIRTFEESNVQMFKNSEIWMFKNLKIQQFGYLEIHTIKNSEIRVFESSNIQRFRNSNSRRQKFEIKFGNSSNLKIWRSRYSRIRIFRNSSALDVKRFENWKIQKFEHSKFQIFRNSGIVSAIWGFNDSTIRIIRTFDNCQKNLRFPPIIKKIW